MNNSALAAQIAAINRSQDVVEFKMDGSVYMTDQNGVRTETEFKWVGLTETRQTEQELEAVVAAVIDGDMQARIELAGKSGFSAMLSQRNK